MSTTLIHTNNIARKDVPGQGQMAEILNKGLCGAEPLAATHQLLYLMEGEGVIELSNKSYDVKKGAGVYLGPDESANITQKGSGTLKLFHLIVPHKDDGE